MGMTDLYAIVKDFGGGTVTLVVDRDTEDYPELDARVRVIDASTVTHVVPNLNPPELGAMHALLSTLTQLEPDERRRVLAWVTARLTTEEDTHDG